MTPESKAALNALLHDSMLERVDVDPTTRSCACALSVLATQLYSAPANPCTLFLHGLGRVRVALFSEVTKMPEDKLSPIDLAGLNGLIRHFNHPQAGFDFIDSTREDIFAGHTMLDVLLSEKAVPHSLTFFWGVGSPSGSKYLLLLRFWFEDIDLLGADGRPPSLKTSALADTYANAGVPFVVVPGFSSGISPMPDAVAPAVVGGESLAILFVDSAGRVRAKAVGKGMWDGSLLNWLAPSGTLYAIPAENQSKIRPALAEWRQPEDVMGGFSFWMTVQVTHEDLRQGGLVRKYLRETTKEHPPIDS